MISEITTEQFLNDVEAQKEKFNRYNTLRGVLATIHPKYYPQNTGIQVKDVLIMLWLCYQANVVNKFGWAFVAGKIEAYEFIHLIVPIISAFFAYKYFSSRHKQRAKAEQIMGEMRRINASVAKEITYLPPKYSTCVGLQNMYEYLTLGRAHSIGEALNILEGN